MVHICISFWPLLLFSPVVVFLPIIKEHVEDVFGCLHLLEASIGVVLNKMGAERDVQQ